MLIAYSEDAKSVLKVFTFKGHFIRKLKTEKGNLEDMTGRKEDFVIYFEIASFLSPSIIYKYDFKTPKIRPIIQRETKIKFPGFDRNKFELKQVFYRSRDGTKIPMYILQKKGIVELSPSPCMLFSYGGFGIISHPGFSVFYLFLLHLYNGIIAVPNIRGGGEYGRLWHERAIKDKKYKSYEDFQWAALYLIKRNYTEPKMLVIYGSSNGGLMVAVCINQQPYLYAMAIIDAGLLDMLRYNKFGAGASWVYDYGDPDDFQQFKNLKKISPIHNVFTPKSSKHQYPITMITTGAKDDRVLPWNSYKLVAELQYAVQQLGSIQKNGIFLNVYSDIGHGDGITMKQVIHQNVDTLVFMYKGLKINEIVDQSVWSHF